MAAEAIDAIKDFTMSIINHTAAVVLHPGDLLCGGRPRRPSGIGSRGKRSSWMKARSKLSVIAFTTFAAAQAAERATAEAADAEYDVLSASLELTQLSVLRKRKPNDNAVQLAHKEATRRLSQATHLANELGGAALLAVQTATSQASSLMSAVSVSALRSSPSLALDCFSKVMLPRLVPALRTALGRVLLDLSALPEGVDVDRVYTLHVVRPRAQQRLRLDAEINSNLSADFNQPKAVVPKLDAKLHRAKDAPALTEVFGNGFFSDSSLGVKDAAGKLHVPVARSKQDHASPHEDHAAAETDPHRASHADVPWPACWDNDADRENIVELDVVLDLGMRLNWKDDPVYFVLQPQHCCLPTLQAGVMALVMRARVHLWWHKQSNQVQLVIVDGMATHFRSFAELGMCGCRPMADHAGLTSALTRLLLSRFSSAHPLEVDLPGGLMAFEDAEHGPLWGANASKRSQGEIRWTSGITGFTYRIPLS
jgi:hypothetical protein